MKNTKENNERKEEILQSGWAGPGIEVWPEEDDYVMWRSIKKMRENTWNATFPSWHPALSVARDTTSANRDFFVRHIKGSRGLSDRSREPFREGLNEMVF